MHLTIRGLGGHTALAAFKTWTSAPRSHTRQDSPHLSTMWPRGDIRRRSSVGRAPDFVSRYVVGPSPTVCTIGVTSCLAAARSVSLRKWSFLCAVRKRQDEEIIGWHRLCKDERMRPTYRRRAEKFRGIPALLYSARVPRRSMDVAWWRRSYD